MATIESRLLVLERTIAAAVRTRPVPFGILPAVGDPRRAAVQAEIAARTKAERQVRQVKTISIRRAEDLFPQA